MGEEELLTAELARTPRETEVIMQILQSQAMYACTLICAGRTDRGNLFLVTRPNKKEYPPLVTVDSVTNRRK